MPNKNIATKQIKKVLFVGLGSIGQRHLQNFKELIPPETTVMAYRTSDFNSVIKNGKAYACKSLANYYNLVEYRSLAKALEQNPDIGFICNPSNLHIETAIKLAKSGSHLFIEKPMATDLKGLSVLEKLIKKNKLITMVGYQIRFHSALKEVRSIIKNRRLGEVVSAEFLWHNYLPDFHAYEDYSKSYAARSNLGGGVVFGLSHELDLIQWLFGLPFEVYAIEGAGGRLKMDVEDTVLALFKCAGNKRIFPVSLSLSYAQGFEERKFSILMQDAVLECDLQRRYLKVIKHDKREVCAKDYNSVTRSDLFKSEMKSFLSSVIAKKETGIPVSEGKKSLIMSLAIRKSLKTNKTVKIKL